MREGKSACERLYGSISKGIRSDEGQGDDTGPNDIIGHVVSCNAHRELLFELRLLG